MSEITTNNSGLNPFSDLTPLQERLTPLQERDNLLLNWEVLVSTFTAFSAQDKTQVMRYLESLSKKILQDVPLEVKEALDRQYNYYAPKDAAFQPELFPHFSKNLVIPGREDLGKFKMIGGLTATGSPWFDFAFKLYDRCGIHTEVCALEGQNGDWYKFRNSTNSKWVEQILDLCKPEDVLFALSTSGNAFTQAWAKKPNFCRAVVGVGWPYFLKNTANQELMEKIRVRTLPLTYFSKTNILKYVHCNYPRTEDPRHARCPQFIRLPISVAVELRKSQIGARQTFSKGKVEGFNFPPIFYAQGADDAPVSPLVRDFIANGFIRSPLKMVPELYKNADHTVQMGPSMGPLLKDVGKFLNALYRYLEFPEEQIPDFQTRIGAVREIKKSVKTFFHQDLLI